jgi:hypothetical protein
MKTRTNLSAGAVPCKVGCGRMRSEHELRCEQVASPSLSVQCGKNARDKHRACLSSCSLFGLPWP